MKPQDSAFIVILVLLIILKGKWAWHAGIAAFLLSGILFLVGNLFTAQRLSWYAAGYLLLAILRSAISALRHRPLP